MELISLIISLIALIISFITLKLQIKSNDQILIIQKQSEKLEEQIKITSDYISQKIDESEDIIRMQIIAES
jgi:hypothetical protein